MRAPDNRGAAFIDVICAASVIAVMSTVAVPLVQTSREAGAARAAGRYLAARLQHARMEALRRNVTVSVRFDPTTLDAFALYADGDGDGVLQGDIDSGVDIAIAPQARLSDYTGEVGLRVNRDVTEPDTGIPIAAGSDPLRTGRSTIVSFSPLGSATSGTLYVAAARGPQMAVRILGATGRLRLLQFDPAAAQWVEH